MEEFMITKKQLIQLSLSAMLAMMTMPVANAQSADAPNPFKACALQNNITLPAKGSGVKLSKEDRKTIFTCVKTAKKAAFVKCAADAGFTPGQGQKPTAEEKVAIKSCMKEQGFKHMHRGHHRHNQENQANEIQQPASN